MYKLGFFAFAIAATSPVVIAVSSQAYSWNNVKIGGGGGFVPNIVFNPTQKGLAYARTDIGGAYRLNADDSWTPLLDFADNARWNYWGVDALATDPIDPKRLYLVSDFSSVATHQLLTVTAYRLLGYIQTPGIPITETF